MPEDSQSMPAPIGQPAPNPSPQPTPQAAPQPTPQLMRGHHAWHWHHGEGSWQWDVLRDQLRSRCVLELPSGDGADFKLSSGRLSRHYVDCRQLLDAHALRIAARLILRRLLRAKLTPDLLLGAPGMGTALAGACLSESCLQGWLGLRGAFCRQAGKTYGLAPSTLQGIEWVAGSYHAGDRTVLLDDVATSGKTLLQVLDHASNLGLAVSAAVVLVDRQEGAAELLAEHAVTLLPLLTWADVVPQEESVKSVNNAE